MSQRDHYAVLQTVLNGRPVGDAKITGNWPDPHPGWAAEFGVWTGTSLGIIAEHMPVIGFDSFEGLPEDWRDGFPKGSFSLNGGDAALDLTPYAPPNAMIVPGLFEATLPTFPFPNLSLVHIDCDLYSSTVTALDYVYPYIGRGTVMVFDEYHGYDGWEDHEAKAWTEFRIRYDLDVTAIAAGEQARAFVIEKDWR